MSQRPRLLAVPNFSEARHLPAVEALTDAVSTVAGAEVLDIHSDIDHNRTVFTVTAPQGALSTAIGVLAARAAELINVRVHGGVHPRIGATDVAPIVYLDAADRGAAGAEALTLASIVGEELAIPVFLYGELSGNKVSRAEIRRGGPQMLATRLATGELKPDFGPSRLHAAAGAMLVASRGPLIAFNVEVAPPADLQTVKRIAALIREGGHEGLPGVRALGVTLASRQNLAQVSTNIEDYTQTTPAQVLAAVARHGRVLGAELVGLAPRAAFGDFPGEIEVQNLRLIEDVLQI